MDLTTTTKLNNGVEMPWVGFGVFQTNPGKEVEDSVRWALEAGYRHIDTAAAYQNEEGVGKAIHEADVPREELFVTTKVWNSDQGYDSTLKAIETSLRKLQMDYVDLYLVHWPVPGMYKETWRAMERILDEGHSRAIGVSNFLIHHLEDIAEDSNIVPAVNQVEFHPFLVQDKLQTYCVEKGIQLEAWSPLTRGRYLDNEVIQRIAKKHGKTPAQVLLRWDLHRNIVTIPKSVHKDRIVENSLIFGFALEDKDIDALNALNEDHRIGPHPDSKEFYERRGK
jgi:diketogulonate reductase-like aldo/keto reductase